MKNSSCIYKNVPSVDGGTLTYSGIKLVFHVCNLQPADNNKNIYKIRKVLKSSVQIEPPRKDKNIIQCMRCQQ